MVRCEAYQHRVVSSLFIYCRNKKPSPIQKEDNSFSTIPNIMTLNKSGPNVSGQPSIMPNVQILNMRPGGPQVAVAAQKSVATVSPRLVITPQMMGARAATPGITLQTLQSLQQSGQQGHLLLKTENGQYQLLRVGPAPASTLTAPQTQTIRLTTVPAQHPGVATVSTSVAAPAQMSGHLAVAAPASVAAAGVTAAAPPQPQSPMMSTQKPLDTTKEKCRNFLANLLDLSSKEPESVERNVRTLIQELIDAQVEPEEFCNRLERLLNASPQPCLIGFLKKSLPLLRQSLVTKELVIEGINPPAPHIAFSTMSALSQSSIMTPNVQKSLSESVPRPPAQPPAAPAAAARTPAVAPAPPPAGAAPPPPVVQVARPSAKSISVLQNIPVQTKINVGKVGGAGGACKFVRYSRGGVTAGAAALSTVLAAGKSLLKEKKPPPPFAAQPFADDKMGGDDDINDVAAMGGVNLAEESQKILGSTDMIGTQIRSCKDEFLIPMGAMQGRLKAAAARRGLEEPAPEVAALLSHAVHERLKNFVEKLSVIAQHRIEAVKGDARYEPTQDVKAQLKFLEELDRLEKKRQEDSEREMLMRAAKSRSKNEDPEQAKLKAKAKEMQRAELEEVRQREANLTALQAIGPRKKPRLELEGGAGEPGGGSAPGGSSLSGRSQLALRSRLKRINLRDLLFLLEQEQATARSPLLYRSYLK